MNFVIMSILPLPALLQTKLHIMKAAMYNQRNYVSPNCIKLSLHYFVHCMPQLCLNDCSLVYGRTCLICLIDSRYVGLEQPGTRVQTITCWPHFSWPTL